MKIQIKNSKDKVEEIQVTVKNEKVKTLFRGLHYQEGDLLKYAEKGELTDEESKRSPALVEMSQEEAKEIVINAIKNKSQNIVITE